MNTVATITDQPTGIVADMARKQGMDKRAFEATLRQTVVPSNCSNEQFAAFLMVARQYDLDPIVKEIYAFPAKGGGITPIVSIDGWMSLINSHPQMDGLTFEDRHDENGKLVAITARIYRKDRTHPIEVTEYMEECKRNTDPWKTWPARMLRHKAAIQAGRYAFGFSGIVEPDEYDRLERTPPTPPTPPAAIDAPTDEPELDLDNENPIDIKDAEIAEEEDMRDADTLIDEFETVISGIESAVEVGEQFDVYRAKPAIKNMPMDFERLEGIRDKRLGSITE